MVEGLHPLMGHFPIKPVDNADSFQSLAGREEPETPKIMIHLPKIRAIRHRRRPTLTNKPTLKLRSGQVAIIESSGAPVAHDQCTENSTTSSQTTNSTVRSTLFRKAKAKASDPGSTNDHQRPATGIQAMGKTLMGTLAHLF